MYFKDTCLSMTPQQPAMNHKFLSTLYNWKDYILNYFVHRVTTSIIEGINNSIKTVKRMGYGFRNFVNFKQRILTSFA